MLDIRLGRLVQIVNVLNVADDIRKIELEWQAKVIAQAVAYTVGEDTDYRDALLDHIGQQNLRGIKIDPATGRSADTRGDSRTIEDIIEKGSTQQALERNMRRKGPGFLGIP